VDRQQRIDLVLRRRHGQAVALDATVARAQAVRQALVELDAEAQNVGRRGGDNLAPPAAGVRRLIAEAVNECDARLAECLRLRARLTRPTLTVGAVGRARTGKSRFLQSLTGLTGEEIPDSSGGFCTGVTSVIRPGPAKSAAVTFRSPTDFLSLIERYYTGLGLGPAPRSLGEVRLLARPDFADGDAVSSELYEALRGYVESLHAHGHLLGQAAMPVSPGDIRAWVTQSDDRGNKRTEFRVVERLDISAPFAGQLAGISVVDLPGLGDTNLGDLAGVVEAAKDDVDVVILLRRPAHLGDDWTEQDFQLYQEVARALPGIPMAQRAFVVLNQVREPSNEAQ
jgi:hypothetical protein